MKIYLGYDRRGEKLAFSLAEELTNAGYDVNIPLIDEEEHSNYPQEAKAVCEKVLKDKNSRGLLICGTGIGIMMAANRFDKIRAVLADSKAQAYFARRHEDANVLVFAGGYKDDNYQIRSVGSSAMEIVKVFLETEKEGGRHDKRVKMLDEIAKK